MAVPRQQCPFWLANKVKNNPGELTESDIIRALQATGDMGDSDEEVASYYIPTIEEAIRRNTPTLQPILIWAWRFHKIGGRFQELLDEAVRESINKHGLLVIPYTGVGVVRWVDEKLLFLQGVEPEKVRQGLEALLEQKKSQLDYLSSLEKEVSKLHKEASKHGSSGLVAEMQGHIPSHRAKLKAQIEQLKESLKALKKGPSPRKEVKIRHKNSIIGSIR